MFFGDVDVSDDEDKYENEEVIIPAVFAGRMPVMKRSASNTDIRRPTIPGKK